MGYWSKKTEQEIDEAVKNKDITGGYDFWPWLLWMRKMYVLGWLGNLAGSIIGWYFFSVGKDWVGLTIGIIFLLSTILIGYKIRQDFKDGKKGFSR